MRLTLPIVGTLLTSAVVTLVLLATPAPASAASYGPGIDIGQGRLGAYLTPLGTQAYCLELEKERPLGPTDQGAVGGWGDLGADDLARLNYVITRFGQSADPVVTSAVNLYVWSVADAGDYGSHGVSGDDYYSARAGDAASTVRSMLATIRAEAAIVVPAGSADVGIELDDTANGRVTVRSDPAGASGTLTIEGAVIAGSDATSTEVTNGSVVEIVGIPAQDAASYSIAASVAFNSTTPLITVHDSGAGQHLAGPGPDSFGAANRVDVRLDFAPVIASQVEAARIVVGERPVDRLTVALAPDSPAPWRVRADGTAVPVVATGVLYGPLATAPVSGASVSGAQVSGAEVSGASVSGAQVSGASVSGADVDPSAPVAWTEQVQLTGPGDVLTSGGFVAQQPGFYTWVWTIEAEGQPEAVLPDGYAWADAFGLATETFEVVPALAQTGAGGPELGVAGVAGGMLLGGVVLVRTRYIRSKTAANP